MRILGIDPGIATIGFGVVDTAGPRISLVKCGVITTPAHTSLASRLKRIYDDMGELLELFKPDAVSIEELFFNTNITTGIAVAHGRGVILLACEDAGVKFLSTRRFRSSSRSSAMAALKNRRSWTWCAAYAG